MDKHNPRARALLLQFTAENHLSLDDRQVLSFVASTLKDDASGLLTSPAFHDEKILPAIIVYGANASGKSNLISAMDFMTSFVVNSHNRGEPGGPTNRRPFALCKAGVAKPSSFAMDFVVDGVRYNYAFEIDDERVLKESLNHFPNNRVQRLFERTKNEFDFGRALKGRNKIIAELTRPNSLFLSAAAQNGHETLSPLVAFIRTIDNEALEPREDDAEVDRKIVEFLESVGSGVTDLRHREVEIDEKQLAFQREFNALIKRVLDATIEMSVPQKQTTIELGHRTDDGSTVYFEPHQESEGTRKLLHLLRGVFRSLSDGEVLLVDEISNSLHTKACERVVALFCNPVTNPKGAQLLATTHDTNLLQASFLRRDQVWFTEKDDLGRTHVYPLTDIKTRKEDDIEKGYLQGRYGAVPFAGTAATFLTK